MSPNHRRAGARWWSCILAFVGCFILSTMTQCVVGGGQLDSCETIADCPKKHRCLQGYCIANGTKTEHLFLDASSPDQTSEPKGEKPVIVVERKSELLSDVEPSTPDVSQDTDLKPELNPDVPDLPPVTPGPSRLSFTSGGGVMTSTGYRLVGSVGAGLLAHPAQMSSPSYRLRGGILSGSKP